MALITCPECGKEFSEFADKCPNCGYPNKKDVAPVEQQEAPANKVKTDSDALGTKSVGCLILAAIALLLFLFLSIPNCGGSSDSHSGTTSSVENYNDNSSFHQILAKNHLVNRLKEFLKDPSSYQEIDYTSEYNYSRECYEVTIKFRAKNSFGAYEIETYKGDVVFSKDGKTVSAGHLKKIE